MTPSTSLLSFYKANPCQTLTLLSSSWTTENRSFFSIQPLRGQWTFSFYKGCHHSSVAKKFLAHALQLVINTWWSLEPLMPLSVSNTSKARAPEWDRSGFNFKLYLYNWCALGCMSLKNWTIHFLGKEVCSKRADWSATKTFGGCHALELVINNLVVVTLTNQVHTIECRKHPQSESTSQTKISINIYQSSICCIELHEYYR